MNAFSLLRPSHKLLRLTLAATLIVGLGWAVTPAHAATITVNTTVDENNNDGDCSLREAIIAANEDRAVDACTRGSGADTIALPAGTYVLTIAGVGEDDAATGDLDITEDLILDGAGRANTTIDGNGLDRVIHIEGVTDVQMSGLTVTGGDAGANNGGGILMDAIGDLTLTNVRIRNSTTDLSGGGLFVGPVSSATLTNSRVDGNTAEEGGGGLMVSGGDVTVIDSRVDNNTADFPGGGGLHVSGFSSVLIRDSRIEANTALMGGGLYLDSFGDATIINSLISANVAVGNIASGGGLHNAGDTVSVINSTISGNSAEVSGGGVYNLSTTTLYNVTVTDNTADSDNNTLGDGGGVSSPSSGPLTLRNTIVSGNADSSNPGTQHADCSDEVNSEGYNLIRVTTGCTITGDTTGNILGQAALLGPLQDNGGPTFTHALLPASPAIDAGNPNGCLDQTGALLTTDQRGYARPVDGDNTKGARCDMGAFEFASPGTPTPTRTPTATPTLTPTPTATATAPPACAGQCLYLPLIIKD